MLSFETLRFFFHFFHFLSEVISLLSESSKLCQKLTWSELESALTIRRKIRPWFVKDRDRSRHCSISSSFNFSGQIFPQSSTSSSEMDPRPNCIDLTVKATAAKQLNAIFEANLNP